MIIEEAIVTRLIDVFPNVPTYAVDWPEAKPSPCIVYRQIGATSEPEPYATTHTATFEFLIVAEAGRDTQRYREVKQMAADVAATFGTGFVVSQPEEFCVANVIRSDQKDQYDSAIQQHWVEAQFSFTYYTED